MEMNTLVGDRSIDGLQLVLAQHKMMLLCLTTKQPKEIISLVLENVTAYHSWTCKENILRCLNYGPCTLVQMQQICEFCCTDYSLEQVLAVINDLLAINMIVSVGTNLYQLVGVDAN